ncbi:MAG: poly-gamma-glutamate synthesis protein (capsule biosynthesis protein) [Saprospiraceae bacterium]|jgi:poly-gamma-glutamate synthesis protein (capsule biosynthesis protein)
MKRIIIFLFAMFLSISNLSANDDLSRLKMLFVGDIMGHGPQIKSAYNAATKSYDYTPCFKFVKPIIEEADLAIGNLEVTLSDQGRYTGYPMFRSPDALSKALKESGFDMLVTSNNHSNDNGAYGVTHTIDVLKNENFYQTGTFKNQTERALYYPLIVYKNDFRLAFLNYTYGTNGMPTKEPTVVNLIDEATIKADIEYAEKLKPDAIIVIMHWGLEYKLDESKVQYDLAQKMFEWGANLVVGGHPHVIQPIKNIPFANKNGEEKTGLTVFSMGNFISNQKTYNTDGGLMVEIELTKKKGSNEAKVAGCKYIPVWRYLDKTDSKKPYGTYYVLPISAFEEEETTDLRLTSSAKTAMKSFGNRMRKHLGKHGGMERMITMADLKLNVLSGKSTTKGIPSVDTIEPRMIIPINDNRYIIDDTEERSIRAPNITVPTINSKPKPTEQFLPVSTDKDGSIPTKVILNLPSIPKPAVSENVKKVQEETSRIVVEENKTNKYLIQIQTARSFYSSGLPFENVIIRESNGLFKYFLGGGSSLMNAKDILEDARNTGFKDAFIVFNKPEETVESVNISQYGTEKGTKAKVYKIQFSSSEKYRFPQNLPVDDFEIIENDERFKYYAGKAKDLTEAMELLKTIQIAGYKDAFIVPFINGKPVK